MCKIQNKFWVLSLITVALLTTGCASLTQSGDRLIASEGKTLSKNEQLLLKTKNYQRLIEINRKSLRNKENPEVRYRLAEYYYLAGNYNSSVHYLTVSLATRPSQKVYLLQSKNLIAQHKYDQAKIYLSRLLKKEPSHAEGINLWGVMLAEQGDFAGALVAFELARKAFYPEEKVLNNMALLHIAQRRYPEAIQLLLPIYQRGYRDDRLTRNLIFALTKTGDMRYAKELAKRENVSQHPDTLISSIFEIDSNLDAI